MQGGHRCQTPGLQAHSLQGAIHKQSVWERGQPPRTVGGRTWLLIFAKCLHIYTVLAHRRIMVHVSRITYQRAHLAPAPRWWRLARGRRSTPARSTAPPPPQLAGKSPDQGGGEGRREMMGVCSCRCGVRSCVCALCVWVWWCARVSGLEVKLCAWAGQGKSLCLGLLARAAVPGEDCMRR